MNVYGEEMILVKNSDGTYKIEVYNYPFEDLKTWFQTMRIYRELGRR